MELLERLADLDAEGACEAVVAAHGRMVAAEAERFVLAAHWADLHSGEALEAERRRRGTRVLRGMERGRQVGADGTPAVAEFAAMELGALQGMGHVAAGCLMRDALNVRHRHPVMWAAVVEGTARVWQARKVAQMCAGAGLSEDQARWVDAQTTGYAVSLPWSRFEALVAAKIIEVDPAAAEERRRAAALARFVRSGQSSEYGLKTLVARAAAGDVVFFVAMVDRVAEVLAEQGDGDPVDVRRSKAIGILATPARALRLLMDAAPAADASGGDTDQTDPDRETDPDPALDLEPDPEADPEAVPGAGPEPGAGPGPGPEGPSPEDGAGGGRSSDVCRTCGGGVAAFVRRVEPSVLLPRATLYVHVSAGMLTGATGVARMEGVGPVTREQVVDLLGHTRVRVVPVVDLAGQVPVDSYEVPRGLGEALQLVAPACVSPWSSNLSRKKDSDHVRPYVPPEQGGRPGQTGLGNLAPLHRFPHRVKTHGRWRLRQRAPGVYEWRSPHGHWFRVDHTGTHRLGRETVRGVRPVEVQEWTPHLRIDATELIAVSRRN